MDMSGLRRARLSLRGPVGNGLDNDPDDVLAVKYRLNDLGLYDQPAYGFTGYIDRGTEQGIRKFQKDQGLKIDGWLEPGGETEQTLLHALPEGRSEKLNGETSHHSATNLLPSTPLEASHAKSISRTEPNLLTQAERRPDDAKINSTPPVQVASSDGIPLYWAPALVKGVQRFSRWMGWEEQALKAAERIADETRKAQEDTAKAEAANRDALATEKPAPLENSRGGKAAQAGNDQGIAKCLEMIATHYPSTRPSIKHVGGGTQDGDGGKKVTEFHLPNANAKKGDHPQLNASRADWTLQDIRKNPGDPMEYSHHNTQTMYADGMTPTKREAASIAQLTLNAIGQLVGGLPKRTKNMSEEEYDKIVDQYCRDQMPKWLGPMEKP